MSDPEKLITEIAAVLEADTEDIRFRLEAKKSLYCFYMERLPPGKQKRIALALSRALKNARSLSRQIEPLFGGMLDESVSRALKKARTLPRETEPLFDESVYYLPRSYVSYEWSLTQGIKSADELAATIIVTRGQRPRDVGKFLAKRLATELSLDPDDVKSINHIATLTYEFITGRRDADISEPVDAYAPTPLRTRRLTMKK